MSDASTLESLWSKCLNILQEEYPSQQFNTWLRPLQATVQNQQLILLAPNRFVIDWVKKNFLTRIQELVQQYMPDTDFQVFGSLGDPTSGC